MWHDNETTTDYLNFGVVADACAKLLQQANGQPISIGVSGGWGVGKSSLVRMVASRLNVDADPDKNTYVVVTFNPWLYQDFEGARSALLQMVGDEVLRRAAADEGLVKKAKRLLQRINLLRVVQLGGEAAATIATGIPIGLIGRALAKFDLGAKAAALLAQAPIKEVGPGLVPLLYEQTWARPVLDQWHASGDASRPVKQAIEQARKGAR